MKKLAYLTSLALILPAAGNAAELKDIKASGFADIVFTLSDGTEEGKSDEERKFDTSAEIDLETKVSEAVQVRLDVDLFTSDQPSAYLEQAFVNWDIDKSKEMAVKTGVYNNRMSWEKEDAPELYQITHGQLYDIWDGQTSLAGNNLQGIDFSVDVSIVKIIAAFVNDMQEEAEENSIQIAADIQAMKDLNVFAGFITQDGGAENMFDVTVTWNWNNLMLGGEILAADKLYNYGTLLTANYAFTKDFSGTLRFDYVDYEGSFDSTSSLTIAGLYTVMDNLFLNAEIRLNDDGNELAPGDPPGTLDHIVGEGDGTTARLEMLATF